MYIPASGNRVKESVDDTTSGLLRHWRPISPFRHYDYKLKIVNNLSIDGAREPTCNEHHWVAMVVELNGDVDFG
jgi:hypothetical protein